MIVFSHSSAIVRRLSSSIQVQELINKQAEWSEEVKNYDAAAEMYIKVLI